MTMHGASRTSNARVFARPLAIAIASLVGLLLGLTGDGWRDAASWLLLGLVPVIIIAAHVRRKPPHPRAR